MFGVLLSLQKIKVKLQSKSYPDQTVLSNILFFPFAINFLIDMP